LGERGSKPHHAHRSTNDVHGGYDEAQKIFLIREIFYFGVKIKIFFNMGSDIQFKNTISLPKLDCRHGKMQLQRSAYLCKGFEKMKSLRLDATYSLVHGIP
jgi:hypothetical protein